MTEESEPTAAMKLNDTQIDELLSRLSCLKQERDEGRERILELERRLRVPFGSLPCALCGGPHDFDTSVPSELWNQVIRAQGLPDYLCATCIVREFVKFGKDFTAKLWGDDFHGDEIKIERLK